MNKIEQVNHKNNMKYCMTTIKLLLLICTCQQQLVSCQQQQQQKHLAGSFPGVSRDLASFCAARPSLPVDLASMIVHVKRNVSFNYKLYLFSSDHVFQTGQVIPRDDFRVHSFPVKVKRFQDFWPSNSSKSSSSSQLFDLKEFFRLVPLNEPRGRTQPKVAPHDAGGDPLPGDHLSKQQEPFISHDVAHIEVAAELHRRHTTDISENLNKFIEFDRDDQISRLNYHPSSSSLFMRSPESHTSQQLPSHHKEASQQPAFEQLVLPVGSFSSFHVNLTYLVRKDFDQVEPQLIKVLVDANKFQVSQWEVIENGRNKTSHRDDFAFLSHKLLRDVNTRITSINQIYEDWITRNFYTIVYVQRRLLMDDNHDGDLKGAEIDEDEEVESEETTRRTARKERKMKPATTVRLINDRLIFRGSSMALLGADQLDYQVKAAAFITEKNGLHYYVEFLNTGKFYLCAVDWQKRPFKIIDWQQFPIKATRTQFDNEELLLCPPAVCYSNRPIDEIVSYGRLDLTDQIQRQISQLSSSHSSSKSSVSQLHHDQHRHHHQLNETSTPIKLDVIENDSPATTTRLRSRSAVASESVESAANLSRPSLNQIIEAVKISAISGIISSSSSSSKDKQAIAVKLHLRDWVWTLGIGRLADNKPDGRLFKWRYELAKRNDIKAKPDAYGYTLTGHEIDASYRIYNELYLISANHLIAINYTLANETVVSSIPVSEEFPGLISTLIDPITGSFYDRYTNSLYFFKGDRYIAFDYGTKKPLEDFILKPSYLHSALWGEFDSLPAADGKSQNNNIDEQQLLSSQPVVGVLGRQHQVDAIYHDLETDLVYIFTGMKFYTFHASEFKDGAFGSETGELPQMYCINERFLDGCNFDKAYRNPCQSGSESSHHRQQSSAKLMQPPASGDHDDGTIVESLKDFNQEQQIKLRSIASKAGLLNVLVENSLIGKSIRTLEPLVDGTADIVNRDQVKLVIYLLIAIVVATILVTIVMILVMISSTSRRLKTSRAPRTVLDQLNSVQLPRHSADNLVSSHALKQQTSNRYLTNHQHHSGIRPYHVPGIATTNNRSTKAGAKPVSTVSVVLSKGRTNRDDIDNSVL